MSQHAALSPERWRAFTLDQQLLQIGAEMHRASRFLDPGGRGHLRACYERILNLVDLTVLVQTRTGLRRELLRWRGLIGALYVAGEPQAESHRMAFRALLQLSPGAARQIPHLGL